MGIKILVTGGTFDKEYDELEGKLFFKDTHIQEMLEVGRCKLPIKIRTLMMIDSMDMTDNDRKIIIDHCKRTEEDKIVITHGTDTLVKTAKELSKEIDNKTIIVTGAMIPYKFGSSDGLFNLGSSLAFVQTLPYGVYVSMNGKYFQPDKVRKNRDTGRFEEID